MEWIESKPKTRIRDSHTRSSLSIYRIISRTWAIQPHNNSARNHNKQRHRYNKYLYTIATIGSLLSPNVALAADVGGVSATANPIANSSGSVTNQAIQVLQGPYITNTYGNAISCQGPTMNITPYATGTGSFKRPFQLLYNDPVYNNADNDDDGIPDNPGEILYEIPTRTGQQEIYNLSLGVSATWSRPLDKTLQALCKDAAATQIGLQKQLTANKRLDFEIARLKNCGELMKAGIMFHPQSPYAKVCADVVLTNPVGVVANHTHGLQPTSQGSSSDETPVSPSSDPVEEQSVPEQTTSQSPSSPKVFGLFRLPALWQGGKREASNQPAALLGGPIQLPPSQLQPSSKQSEE